MQVVEIRAALHELAEAAREGSDAAVTPVEYEMMNTPETATAA